MIWYGFRTWICCHSIYWLCNVAFCDKFFSISICCIVVIIWYLILLLYYWMKAMKLKAMYYFSPCSHNSMCNSGVASATGVLVSTHLNLRFMRQILAILAEWFLLVTTHPNVAISQLSPFRSMPSCKHNTLCQVLLLLDKWFCRKSWKFAK